jgi:hypothetical protein
MKIGKNKYNKKNKNFKNNDKITLTEIHIIKKYRFAVI